MAEIMKQWYEENPDLLAAEKAALEKMAKDDYKEFGFLKDGRAYWNIGFISGLSNRKYTVILVYPMNHPSKIEIPGIRVYPVEPTYEMIVEEINKASGRSDGCIPYSMRDCNGNYSLSIVSADWLRRNNTLESKQGIISAATVLLETKRWIFLYEKSVANHGNGFYNYFSIDRASVNSEKEKQACIDYYSDPAVRFYRENPVYELEENR